MTDDAITLGFTPDWPTCAHDTGRCTGRRIDGYEHCLAHITGDDLDNAFRRFTPGADLDLRGTTLTAQLLNRLLTHMNNSPADPYSPAHLGRADFSYCSFPADDHDEDPLNTSTTTTPPEGVKNAGFYTLRFSGSPVFIRAQFNEDAGFIGAQFDGDAVFIGAQFTRNVGFLHVQFSEDAVFDGAQFDGDAVFTGAQFNAYAKFGKVQFNRNAVFDHTQFSDDADFASARFSAYAGFYEAQFTRHVTFGKAQFSGDVEFVLARFSAIAVFSGAQFDGHPVFAGAQFREDAQFIGAKFEVASEFGPLAASELYLDNAVFVKRVVVELDAGVLSASDTRFEGGAELRVHYASVALQRTFFGGPSSLSGAQVRSIHPAVHIVFVVDPEQIRAWTAAADGSVSGDVNDRRAVHLEEWIPRVLSLQETDVSQLTLTDVDLRWCRLAGAHQLDKLRLEGRGPFNRPPPGWWIGRASPPVWRWTSRRVLAEEHPWRAGRRKSDGWTDSLPDLRGAVGRTDALGPERLAVLYRSLRKALEDARNEAGAGDFYYGEMEARRHAPSTGRWERALLTTYWMLSGYGQRASRALAALVVLVGVLFVLLTWIGLSNNTAVQQMTGTIPAAVAGQPRQVTIEVKPVPATLPPEGRWSSDRMAKAARIALGSVIFRDADQQLTLQGQWTVMAGRAFGPLLLALAALAVRARVKR